jgi:hypothetical protein
MANWQTYGAGLHNAGSYISSGTPYITGSDNLAVSGAATACQDNIPFPSVTKSVTVINRGTTELRIHFANAKTQTTTWAQFHYVSLPNNNDSVTLNVKCADIYVSNPTSTVGKYTLFAELTGIPAERMFILSGSGINEDNGLG